MKKLILAMFFVFATGTMMNANSSNEINESIKGEFIEVGPAGDCVKWAKGIVYEIAGNNNQHPNDEEFYLRIYMRYYTGCLRE